MLNVKQSNDAKTQSKSNIYKSNSSKSLNFYLAGNPNCGKTTLFNQLTGSLQYVGNWPGVTVEKKEGQFKHNNTQINLLDLPGIYSLSPYSPEEVVTRNCLIKENPDLIINIVDSTNIERNLYLTTQLIELGKPIVIALNMVDLLKKRGDTINFKLLENLIGVPIFPISANKGIGIRELIDFSISYARNPFKSKFPNIYSSNIDMALKNIEDIISQANIPLKINKRWLAVKIFEGDKLEEKSTHFNQQQKEKIKEYISQIKTTQYVDREMIIADQRYKFICKTCSKTIKKSHKEDWLTITDKIDKIIINKFLAIPIFLSLVLIIFYITFGPFGNFLKEQAEWFIKDFVGNNINNFLTMVGTSTWAKSLVVDGIIEGVGSVISFLPQIMILFSLLSLLEDSGYMARVAFIMDHLLRKIGLSGKAFVPMLMGFGCTVPAVLGTRILENKRDKQLTIMLTPFMSCSAKMPVYALFISEFFSNNKPLIIFSIYLLGIIVAIFTAWLFKNTILKGEKSPFVMELPPYRFPTCKSLWLHIWERLKDFLVKAGTILLGASIVIWFLQSFNFRLQMVQESSQSMLAIIGSLISPIFTLCGFGNWQSSVSLVSGLVAKETIVSTMSVLYDSGIEYNISNSLAHAFTPLSAYSFIVFVLLYTPCVAAMSVIKKEMGSTKLTIISICYQLFIAWFVSAIVYQFGTLIFNIIK